MADPNRQTEVWIDTSEGLEPWVEAIATCGSLALDTESNSMFAYRERVCLVQVSCLGAVGAPPLLALDPIALGPLCFEPIVRFFATGRTVLMHGGEYDVAVLKRDLGVGPSRVFDTQAAASLLGIPRTGYSSLVEELLEVTLAKEHQQFDWGRRPVPAAARRYALDDVRYLPALAKILQDMADEMGLRDEVEVACQAVCEAAPHMPLPESERFWRVVKKVKVKGEALERLFALFLWRESEAEARDIPPARLVPNEVLGKLATRPPSSVSELEGLGLSRKLVSDRADALVRAANTRAEVPPRPSAPRPDPKIEKRESTLKRWREEEATRRGVTLAAVLPARALEALAEGVPLEEVPQLGSSRLSRYGQILRTLVSG